MTDGFEAGATAAMEGRLGALFDDPEFHGLHRRMSRFNLFEAMGAVRGELRHSNFLGYLLSPNRPHGLGARPLSMFLRRILERLAPSERPVMTLEIIAGELDDAIVYRERDSIDILIDLPALNLVVAIENKVGAKAGPGQLARYHEVLASNFAGRRKLLIFLTPHGGDPDHEAYVAYDYADLATTLEELINTPHEPTPTDTTLIIRHYVEMLRRHIVQDETLKSLAVTLYERHREAFDFIFECRPPPATLLNVVRECALGVQGLTEDSFVNGAFRFVPQVWDEQFSAIKGDPTKWTKSGRCLLFEAKTNAATPGRVTLTLMLGPGDAAMREGIYAAAIARPKLFKKITKPMTPQWTALYSQDLLTADQAKPLSFEARAFNVRAAWGDFQGQALQTLIDTMLEIDEALLTTLE